MPFIIIEAPDKKTGKRYSHTLPVTERGGFKTEETAEAFIAKMCNLGYSCVLVIDDEDMMVFSYIGHTLSPSCPCCPKPKESDESCLIHSHFN